MLKAFYNIRHVIRVSRMAKKGSEKPKTAAENSTGEMPELDAKIGKRLRKELGDERLVELYDQMVRMRRFEEQAGRSYQMGKIKGFCHLYIGQEAVAAGSIGALEERDYVVAAYREHAQAMARGLSENDIMAELYGKASGVSKGKGGSMHLFDAEKHFYGGWGIVGGQIPTATGVAFAAKYRQEDAVCIVFMGDGTVPQGAFHESLNLASIWDLPIVYIIENNGYGMGTAVDRISAIDDMSVKGASFNIKGVRVEDAQDIFKVYACISEAVEYARKEHRPMLVQLDTYRYRGHSMSDPATYRTKDEVTREQQRDPIQRFTHWLVENKIRSEDELKEIDAKAKTLAKDAAKYADAQDFPSLDTLTQDVYVEWPWAVD